MSIKDELWAKENLNPARARAFLGAVAKLEGEKFSREYREAQNAINMAVMDNERAIKRDADEAWEKWSLEDKAIEEQIRELRQKQRELSDARDAKIQELRNGTGFFESESLRALQDRVSTLWRRDDEALKPKLEALREKYLKAQKDSEKSTLWEVRGYYAQGWEAVYTASTKAEAVQILKDYRESEKGTAFDLKMVRG